MIAPNRSLHAFDDSGDHDSGDGDSGPSADGAAAASPKTASVGPTQVLYLTEPGDTSAISVNDLHQGQLGDCFLISSIGELAISRPSAIQGMIHVNANGTETVTLHEAANGRLPAPWTTAFKPVQITVTNMFPNVAVNGGATQDVVGGQKEIWAQVIEKAVATLDGGYGAIAYGGNPTTAMEELTGHAASFMSAAGLTQAELQGWSAAGDLVTFDTNAASRVYNLVGDHAYMFEGLTTANGAPAVKLGNPWGFDQPTAVPIPLLGRVFAEVDVGRVS